MRMFLTLKPLMKDKKFSTSRLLWSSILRSVDSLKLFSMASIMLWCIGNPLWTTKRKKEKLQNVAYDTADVKTNLTTPRNRSSRLGGHIRTYNHTYTHSKNFDLFFKVWYILIGTKISQRDVIPSTLINACVVNMADWNSPVHISRPPDRSRGLFGRLKNCRPHCKQKHLFYNKYIK